MKSKPVDPSEWIECGHVAVRTRSVLTAARVAAKVHRSRQAGMRLIAGRQVEFMCLARFRETLAASEAS